MQNKEALTATEQISVLTSVYELLKTYPLLDEDTQVYFDELRTDENNIAILSSPGSTVDSRNILGGFKATLPFTLVWAGIVNTPHRKINVVNVLNTIGAWLSREKIKDDSDNEHQLMEYPALSDGRIIEKIEQISVPYISGVAENGSTKYECTVHVKYYKEA